MSTETLFRTHLVLDYVAWLLCFGAYVWPWLRSMDRVAAHRIIANLHSFRSSGSSSSSGCGRPNLPPASPFALGDFATGVLSMLSLLTVRIRSLFWPFVLAFNLAGAVNLIVDYYNAIQVGLPAHAEWLSATYAIPIIYVPLLMIAHIAAFYLLA